MTDQLCSSIISSYLESHLIHPTYLNLGISVTSRVENCVLVGRKYERERFLILITSSSIDLDGGIVCGSTCSIYSPTFSLSDKSESSGPNHDELKVQRLPQVYVDIEKLDTTAISISGVASCAVKGFLLFASRNHHQIRVNVYAPHYLFIDSITTNEPNALKKLRSDRSLIAWWIKCLTVHDLGSNISVQRFIPGETPISVRSLFPAVSQTAANVLDWDWGLGLDIAESAHILPAFEDDLVSKSLSYIPSNAKISDLMDIMDVMEGHAGIRGILTLIVTNTVPESKPKRTKSPTTTIEWAAMISLLQSLPFHFQSIQDSSEHFIQEIEMESTFCTIAKNDPTINLSNQKEKKEINVLNPGMIKKNAVSLNSGLIKKKPVSLASNILKKARLAQ